ncbi:hypothetical protein PG984_012801 [Apiospora sp. TS-2023a]
MWYVVLLSLGPARCKQLEIGNSLIKLLHYAMLTLTGFSGGVTVVLRTVHGGIALLLDSLAERQEVADHFEKVRNDPGFDPGIFRVRPAYTCGDQLQLCSDQFSGVEDVISGAMVEPSIFEVVNTILDLVEYPIDERYGHGNKALITLWLIKSVEAVNGLFDPITHLKCNRFSRELVLRDLLVVVGSVLFVCLLHKFVEFEKIPLQAAQRGANVDEKARNIAIVGLVLQEVKEDRQRGLDLVNKIQTTPSDRDHGGTGVSACERAEADFNQL